MPDFHNPYHFVPARPGGRTDDLCVKRFRAHDTGHVTHARAVEGSHSGRLICRLTTETPTVVGGKQQEGTYKRTPTTVKPFEIDHRPAIPASTLAGLISSIAEAASNSALRILDDRPYSYRKGFGDETLLSAIGMVVADETKEGDARWRLRPLTLPTLPVGDRNASAPLPALYRKMFPEPRLKVFVGHSGAGRDDDDLDIRSLTFRYCTYRADRERFFGMKLKQDWGWNRKSGQLPADSQRRVKEIRKGNRSSYFVVGQRPTESTDPEPWDDIDPDEQPGYTRGIMRVLGCWGRDDIPTGKKHEIFIPYPEGAEQWPTFPILPEAVERFRQLADERTKASEDAAFSWPYEPRSTDRGGQDGKFRLKTGDLVYFRPTTDGKAVAEIALSSIWRGRVESGREGECKGAGAWSFFRSIDPELVPFHGERCQITVAEQLFGFVEEGKAEGQEAALALASRVRFSHAYLERVGDEDYRAWRSDQPGNRSPYMPAQTLKILSSPKPPSPALYFRPRGAAGYVAKKELAPESHTPQGRKFYLHHRDTAPDPNGKYPWETCAPDTDAHQKMRVTPVMEGAAYYFHIDFDNLSRRELGLLAYALVPTDDFRHKLGLGRPLGLGTVHVEPVGLFTVKRHNRYTAAGLFQPRYQAGWWNKDDREEARDPWPDSYAREQSATTESADLQNVDFQQILDDFRKTVDPDIRKPLELLGSPPADAVPVHTPQVAGADLEAETFQWFVQNDRTHRKALPSLDRNTKSLPTLPRHPVPQQGGGGRGQGGGLRGGGGGGSHHPGRGGPRH